MIEALTVYFVAQAATVFWFYSPIKTSLFYMFTKEHTFNSDNFDLLLLSKSSLFKVLTCTFCFSFWTSIAVACVISHDAKSFIFNLSFTIVMVYLYEQILNFLKKG
ncbi:hypothetical protein EBR43_09480 [bacterium]|nr:hypothetical protein [bacterium]